MSPTGRLHLGHYVGSLRRRVELQNSGVYDKIFIMIADAQALTDNADNPDELKAHYKRGGLGDVKVKRFLIAILEEELAPIRARRKEWEQKIHEVYALLQQGCEAARAVAADTLNDVRRAMKINYFENKELIEEQAKKFAEGK